MAEREPLWFIEKVDDEERVTSLCRGCGRTHMPGARVIRVSEKDFWRYIEIDKMGKLRGTILSVVLACIAAYIIALIVLMLMPIEYKPALSEDSFQLLTLGAVGLFVFVCGYLTYRPRQKHNLRVLEQREAAKREFLRQFGDLAPGWVYSRWFFGMDPRAHMLLPEGVDDQLEYDHLFSD